MEFLTPSLRDIPNGSREEISGDVPRGQKNPLNVGLARRLFRIRERSSLSASRVALLAGLSINTVRTIEDGAVPAIDTVERIAAVIGVHPGWIAFGNEGRELFQERRPREPFPSGDPEIDEQFRCFRDRAASCGARILFAREKSGLSMRKLASAAGLSVQTWSNAEAGVTVPKVDSLERMAVALNVPPTWLAYGDDEAQA